MIKINKSELPEMGFLRLPQVLHFFPVSRGTWYNGIQAGKYPKPIKLSERISAWRVSDIKALIDATQ
jgi:predicted DNA-binding transcriptional regulator AlpA